MCQTRSRPCCRRPNRSRFAGGFAAIVALFALLVTETDEAFANVYSAAISLQNIVPQAPQKLLLVLVTATATTGALVIDLVSYQSFLLLLGSVFVPLFAVLLADWLSVGRHYAYALCSARRRGGRGSSRRGSPGSPSTSGCIPPGPRGGSTWSPT